FAARVISNGRDGLGSTAGALPIDNCLGGQRAVRLRRRGTEWIISSAGRSAGRCDDHIHRAGRAGGETQASENPGKRRCLRAGDLVEKGLRRPSRSEKPEGPCRDEDRSSCAKWRDDGRRWISGAG